jgi:transporter family-2 protein
MSATTTAITLSLVAGVAGALQASLSGNLGKRIGVVEAGAFGALLAGVLIAVLAVSLGRGGGIAAALRQPAWLWLTGVMGAIVVLTITFAPPKIGTFATIALLIAGQLIAGALVDAFGWLGSDRIPITLTRASGLVLLAAGAFLTLKR